MQELLTDARYMATNLRDEIARQGRKIVWIADQIGVSHALISLVCDGKRSIDAERAQAIADVLGVEIESIFVQAAE
jgi:DNA-binding transcriptional regulator YdaS (Cro superfamily)